MAQKPPHIGRQPRDTSASVGDTVTFSVNVTGTAPLVFRWIKDGFLLESNPWLTGLDGEVLTINSVKASDSGKYSVKVTNASGEDTSAEAVLTVTESPPENPPKPPKKHDAELIEEAESETTAAVMSEADYIKLVRDIFVMQAAVCRDFSPADALGLAIRFANALDSGQLEILTARALRVNRVFRAILNEKRDKEKKNAGPLVRL
jgi:hypothetical protein